MSDVGFETVLLRPGNWRQRAGRKPSQAGWLFIWLSREAWSSSYINGVVPFVADLLPTSWAGVSILQGVAEALATEDVATLCRDNETSILHDLRVSVHADGTANGARGPQSCGALVPGTSGGMGGDIHIPVPGQLLIITAHHAAVCVVLALAPHGPPWPPSLFNDHNRVIVSQVDNHRL